MLTVVDLGIPFIEVSYDAAQEVPTVREERVHGRIGEVCGCEDALTAAMRFEFVEELAGDAFPAVTPMQVNPQYEAAPVEAVIHDRVAKQLSGTFHDPAFPSFRGRLNALPPRFFRLCEVVKAVDLFQVVGDCEAQYTSDSSPLTLVRAAN